MAKQNAVLTRLKRMKDSGVRKIGQVYTRKVNGKTVLNYRNLAITAGVLAAAGAGAYYLKKHHDKVVLQKKRKATKRM